jgi:hypothetical protein
MLEDSICSKQSCSTVVVEFRPLTICNTLARRPLALKISMSASGNASPSLHRLESALDNDDGDEVNWSIEHGSTPIWRSARFGFSSPHRISKTAPKICVCRIPVRRGGRLSQANRKMRLTFLLDRRTCIQHSHPFLFTNTTWTIAMRILHTHTLKQMRIPFPKGC